MKNKYLILLASLITVSCTNIDNQKIAERLVKNYLDSTLNDSKSYQSIEFGSVHRLNDTIVNFEGKKDTIKYGGIYSIFHKYKAKNGLGGYIVKSDYFHIDSAFKIIDCCFKK